MQQDIIVFGGRNRANLERQPAWNAFEAAIALWIRNGKVVRRLEYGGTSIEAAAGVSRCFKSATIINGNAFVCTNTEVLRIGLDHFSIEESWSNKYFNDLHHVHVGNKGIFVVSTGIDSILEFDSDFKMVRRVGVGTDAVMARYEDGQDFRCIPSTKPHEIHPNFVTEWDDRLWYTDFANGRVSELGGTEYFTVADAPIHDGRPEFGKVWFTAVKGCVITFDRENAVWTTHNLPEITKGSPLLGWCRGIAPFDRDRALVGFTKLRRTIHSENVRWIDANFARLKHALRLPTRISLYDLRAGAEVWRLPLAPLGLDAIFSVHVLNDEEPTGP